MISNVPLFLSYLLSIIVMIGLPIFMAIFFTRRFKVSWWVVLTGVLTFAVAYVLNRLALSGVNTLFNKGILSVNSTQWFPVFVAVIVGLLAAVTTETSRWAGFKILNLKILGRKAERFGSAFAAAAGHGGAESIYFCVAGIGLSLVTVLFYNPAAQLAKGVSSESVQYALSQIQYFWTSPWHSGLLIGVEQVINLSLHLFLSTLVWKAVADRSAVWFFLALLYHLIVVAVSVFLQQLGWNSWLIQGVMAIFMLLNLYMVYRFWKDESEIEEEMDELSEDELEDEEDEEDEEDDDDEDENDEDDDEDEEDEREIDHPEGDKVNGESAQE